MEKDYKISYIRAISTVLVVLIHIAQKISITYSKASLFSDWFNVGLVMFFVISAYLYSQRTIEFPKKWLLKRYMELIIPSIIVVIITVSVFCLFTDVVTTSKVICAFLSGMGFEEFVPDKWVFIQLWYLTYILICYLLIPLIQKIKFKEMNCLLFWGGIIAATIIFQGIPIVIKTFLSIDISISWAQLFRFLFPYVIFRRYDFVSGKLKRIMCVLTVLSLSAILVTCYVRYMINLDGLFASVAELIYIYTLTITGVVLFYWLYLFLVKLIIVKIFVGLQIDTRILYT